MVVRRAVIAVLLLAVALLPEALAAPPAPSDTEVWLSVGVRYDRDFSINPDRIARSSSFVQETRFSGYDERAVGSWRLRSLAAADVFTDLDDHARDFQIASGSLGPVFELGEAWRLHAAVGGWVSFFGYDFYTGLGAGYLTLERTDSVFRSVALHAGVEHFGAEFGRDDVPWVDLFVEFGWEDLWRRNDWLDGQLYLEHYQADEARFRYEQVALTLGYDVPLVGPVRGAAHLTGWQRFYHGSEPDVGSKRRDTTLTAVVSVVHTSFFLESLLLEVRGQYERNWSNDDFQDYDGQSVVVVLHWRF